MIEPIENGMPRARPKKPFDLRARNKVPIEPREIVTHVSNVPDDGVPQTTCEFSNGSSIVRTTEGFCVTALYEASDYELMKLYQRERPLPQSEGDRAATSVKTMLGDRRITLHAIHDR